MPPYVIRMSDSDLDGVFDKLDNCPATSNANQRDTDRNGIGDACELTANAGVDQFLSDLDENGTEQSFWMARVAPHLIRLIRLAAGPGGKTVS